MTWLHRAAVLVVVLGCPLPALAQKNFGFDNRKPSGQPYLKPEESLARMKVADGFEVKLFAAEPDIINPIAFTVDERGRLWVVECFEYPQRTPKGQKPRDRIKILEDTDGDGKCDKVTIWAEGKDLPIGFDMASGIEVGHGGVFLGAPPYLFFLQDTDGDGKCDKQEILLEGFGSQDTHETLNTFQWGPDGRLYGLHGIFTQSKVGDVKLNAAVWRYDVKAKKFEVFAEGTSNPWGMDFDDRGNAFLCCCVIPHLFHISQGGTYKRQAGQSNNPYAYGLLNEICDHTFHRESGWAHAGLLCLQGEHIPEQYRGSVIFGSIHGCSVKRNTLKPNGSTFTGSRAEDFLVSGDKNFRPINLRWGPDGSIYLIDWHDQNPCHQAAPDSWDRKHGRIFKIQPKGSRAQATGQPFPNQPKELIELLRSENPWVWRTALQRLGERWRPTPLERVPDLDAGLRQLAFESKDEVHALRGLWALHATSPFFEDGLKAMSHPSLSMRSWAVRLVGDEGRVPDPVLTRLIEMAKNDPAPQVRLQLAGTAQRLTKQDTFSLVNSLMQHKEDAKDLCLPLMYWLAYEPHVAAKPQAAIDWLKQNATGNPLITEAIVPRTMRRLVATGKAEDLAACVTFLGDVADPAVRQQALDGLVQALQNRQLDPPADWKRVRTALFKDKDSEVQRLARKLAVNFRDEEAIRRSLGVARDASRPEAERLEAIRDLALAHPAEGLQPLQELLQQEKLLAIRCEACRALSAYDESDMPAAVLGEWKGYPPPLRSEVVQLLASRREWARALLTAVGKKEVARTELTDNTILRIRAFKDAKLNDQIETVWGRFRDTPAELNTLIGKMREHLHTSRGSAERGRKVFENQCAKCHKFDGKGAEVGPNLDGAARDIEYLLANVLDPNRVVGQPYYLRTVVLKSGKSETGLLAAEDDQSITIKGENDQLKVMQKKDVDEIVVQDKSIMPEGLANSMTPQDFTDLIRYVMAHPYLSEVAVAGPFPINGSPIRPEDPFGSKDVSWSRPLVGPPGRIALPTIKDADGTCFVAAEVTAPKALKTTLQLAAASPLRVWLNGQPIYQGKPGPDTTVDNPVAVDVTLPPGINRLVLQVTYQGTVPGLYARFLDPDRVLQYSEPKLPAP